MKKVYTEPVVEVILFKTRDCIKASATIPSTDTTTTVEEYIMGEDSVGDANGNGNDLQFTV